MPPEAPLFGLVLTGGESRRMGVDKGDLSYFGVSQRRHVAGLLATVCEASHVSCRADQAARVEPELNCLPDLAPGLGPLAGVAAAFAHRPDAAWLVVACDMPALDVATLRALSAGRGPEWDAVAFRAPDGGPEPMAALWEPAMGPLVQAALAAGRLSPRDALKSARCRLITPPEADRLFNANTPNERDQARWRQFTR